MKWFGEHIWPFKSRFRNDVIIEKDKSLYMGTSLILSNSGTTTTLSNIDAIDAGTVTVLTAAVPSVNIDALSALGGTGLHQTEDHFLFSDDGTEKKITFSNLEDAIFANINSASSDIAIAAGGAITLANNSVGTAEVAFDYVRDITGGTGITSTGATSGEGIQHSLSVDASQGQITTVGTIGAGTWEGTTIAVDQGGTGATTLTTDGVLFGNGTSAISAVDLSASGNIIVGGGTPAVVTGANLAGTNLTAVTGDGTLVLNVDDAFLVNDDNDTTTGTITAGGFTTTGTWTFDEYTSGTIGITTVQDSGTTFDDNDTSLMTAGAIDNRISAIGGDITGVTIITDSGAGAKASDINGSADFSLLGGNGMDVTNSGTTITAAVHAAQTTISSVVKSSGLVIGTGGDVGCNITFNGDDNMDFNFLSGGVSPAMVKAMVITPTIIGPDVHNAVDLGTTSKRWKNGYFEELLVSAGGFSGNATTATALATSRDFQVDLASTSTAGFTGAANCTPGVTGTLAVGNGGTGVAGITALKNLLDDETWTFANNITGTLATVSQPNITTLAGVTSIGTAGDTLDILSTNTYFESGTVGKPIVKLTNVTDDQSGPVFILEKLRADDGVTTGQDLGSIRFRGQDSDQNVEDYASIYGEIDVGISGQESGKLSLQVASDNGTTREGLVVTGGDSGEVDVIVGLGAASVTTVSGDLAISGDTITSAADLTITATGNDITLDTDDLYITSVTASYPHLHLTNTRDDNAGPVIFMENDKGGAAGDDGDSCGIIRFDGRDAGTDVTSYAWIEGSIVTAAAGNETGKLELKVAEFDSTKSPGLTLTGAAANTVVNATIGNGAASVTTVAGSLRPVGQIWMKNVSYVATQGTAETFIPLAGAADNPSVANGAVGMLMPVNGKLLKVHLKTQRDHSGVTTTIKMYNWDADEAHGTSTNTLLGSVAQTGPADDDVGVFDFQSVSTNAFTAGEMLAFSITNGGAVSSSCKYFVTLVFELDWTSY